MSVEQDFSLDPKLLERLAALICGDEEDLHYRTGYEIAAFFRAAGWSVPGDVDGPRRGWTLARLREHGNDGQALATLVLRLADPREYVDERDVHATVLQELDELLELEGFEIVRSGRQARLVARTSRGSRATLQAPAELRTDLDHIVSNPGFGVQLQARLEEAYCCLQAGAPTAAIIMLGSVLEGVLYDVALHRHNGGRRPSDHLETLINTAGEQTWISRDVVDYAHVLRDQRNLVHPRKQWTQAYKPEADTALIAWNVVVAALNDLSELGPPPELGNMEADPD